jgi:hypothetical protein
MRSCSDCGQQIDKTSAFCPACGKKVPPEALPTESQASVRNHVDPLASTAPASFSPARKSAPQSSDPLPLVSPKAGTGYEVSPVRAESAPPKASAAAKKSTRGKTAPLSAMPNPPKFAVQAAPPPAAGRPVQQPQAMPAFAPLAQAPPAGYAQPQAPPARASSPQSPRGVVPGPSAPPAGLVMPIPGAGVATPGSGGYPPMNALFAPGKRVLVQWANGQKYPGVVEQLHGAQCLVRFDAGEKRWVETRFVFPGA